MKQYLSIYISLLLSLLIGVSSCSSEVPIPEEKLPKVEFPDFSEGDGEDLGNEGVVLENTSDGAKATFEPEANTAKVRFETNSAWCASVSTTKADGDWVAVNPISGDAGTVTLNITLEPNSSTDERLIYVKITADSVETIITVLQKGANLDPDPEPEPNDTEGEGDNAKGEEL